MQGMLWLRKRRQISSRLFAGNASRINYSFKDCSDVGYGRVWGEGAAYARIVIHHLPPPTKRQGACAEVEMQDRSRFVSLTGIEVGCIDIIYHNTRTKQISSIMFWARHPDKF